MKTGKSKTLKPFKSIRKESFWSAKCVKCGELFCNAENTYDLYKTKGELVDQLKEFGWYVVKNKVLCENCQ